MEAQLYRECRSLRKRGLKVKGFWFNTRGKQLLEQMNSETLFKFFLNSSRISFRRSTNVSHRPASDKESAVRTFHKNICHIALQGEQTEKVRIFGLHQVINVDQTPLPFPSALLIVLPMLTLGTKKFGFEGVDLGWRRDSVQPRLP